MPSPLAYYLMPIGQDQHQVGAISRKYQTKKVQMQLRLSEVNADQ
jgi:hypothetical protein